MILFIPAYSYKWLLKLLVGDYVDLQNIIDSLKTVIWIIPWILATLIFILIMYLWGIRCWWINSSHSTNQTTQLGLELGWDDPSLTPCSNQILWKLVALHHTLNSLRITWNIYFRFHSASSVWMVIRGCFYSGWATFIGRERKKITCTIYLVWGMGSPWSSDPTYQKKVSING